MAAPDYDATAFWPATSVFAEDEVRELFNGYQICRFTEHKSSGTTAQGVAHDWHIFSVVAKKRRLRKLWPTDTSTLRGN